MRVRTYGESGPRVVLLHGGPGAPGHMAPIGRGLADAFSVLEPFQRGSGGEPLTVARHVEDLRELVATRCPGGRPGLVGSSWGAMLALAFAAAHPTLAGPIVLVGCGTFDLAARARMRAIIEERTTGELRAKLSALDAIPDLDERLSRRGELIDSLSSFDPLPDEDENELVDAGAHEETWRDMIRLQEEGVYPGAFAAIASPILMLHGELDPHPGEMIRESLAPHLARLEYREWERCGHYPWRERAVRDEFFRVLRAFLSRHLTMRS